VSQDVLPENVVQQIPIREPLQYFQVDDLGHVLLQKSVKHGPHGDTMPHGLVVITGIPAT
jgi:hypothetical protein